MTADRQTFVEPRFSPDGKRLAVQILGSAGSDCWVYDLERGTATRLTFHEGDDAVPVWSPDGSWIVFASNRDGQSNLFRKQADGSGEEEPLTAGKDDLFPSAWSPDGRWILVTALSAQTGNDILAVPLEGDREPQPYLVTQFSEAEAAFSPDGRWVAYQSEESGRSEVYVRPFPMRGGKWQISVAGGTHPRWGPGGRELYFRNGNAMMMVEVEVRGDALRAGAPGEHFEGPFVQAAIGGNVYADYDVSPDGQRFAMLRGENRQAVPDHLVVVMNWFDELDATFGPR
jgi:Tol biopolymer transport system component